jgi:polyhydroxybutyrate depolymerase
MFKYIIAIMILLLTGLVSLTPILAQEATQEATQEPIASERTYELFVPSSYDDAQPTPLVLALHGAGGTGADLQQFIEFDTVAEERGYIVAYPDSFFENWDFTGRMSTPEGEYVDDVGFLTGLVDTLMADYNIDPTRLYVMGYSNGASMGYQLVCSVPGTFVGLAAVAAPLGWRNALNCIKNPYQTTSLLLMQGTDDQILSWRATYDGNSDQLVMLSAPGTVSYWAAFLGCDYEKYDLVAVPDINTEDDSLVRVLTFATCPDNMQAVLYAVIGGGHAWPGVQTDVPVLNPVNMDIDANTVILDWFTSLGQAN